MEVRSTQTVTGVWILDDGFIHQVIIGQFRIAFGDVKLIAMKVTRAIEPGSVIERGHIDDQGLALPMPH